MPTIKLKKVLKEYTVVLKEEFLLSTAVYTQEHSCCLFDVCGPVVLGECYAKSRRAAITIFQKRYEKLYGHAPRKLFKVL